MSSGIVIILSCEGSLAFGVYRSIVVNCLNVLGGFTLVFIFHFEVALCPNVLIFYIVLVFFFTGVFYHQLLY